MATSESADDDAEVYGLVRESRRVISQVTVLVDELNRLYEQIDRFIAEEGEPDG